MKLNSLIAALSRTSPTAEMAAPSFTLVRNVAAAGLTEKADKAETSTDRLLPVG
ncbi:MAG: hypothetical protein KBG85_03000 [Micropruina sp.]|nr:hypothetical protein [Micropruina sp.]